MREYNEERLRQYNKDSRKGKNDESENNADKYDSEENESYAWRKGRSDNDRGP